MTNIRALPLFPLNTVLYPNASLPLQIFEERYKIMLRDCMESDSKFGVALIREGAEVGGSAVPREIGTVAHIVQVNRIEGDRFFVSAIGQQRFRILEVIHRAPYLEARVEILDEEGSEPAPDHLIEEAAEAFSEYARCAVGVSGGWVRQTRVPSDAAALSYHIAARMQLELEDKQRLLEHPSARSRLSAETEMLRRHSRALRRRMAWELSRRFSRH